MTYTNPGSGQRAPHEQVRLARRESRAGVRRRSGCSPAAAASRASCRHSARDPRAPRRPTRRARRCRSPAAGRRNAPIPRTAPAPIHRSGPARGPWPRSPGFRARPLPGCTKRSDWLASSMASGIDGAAGAAGAGDDGGDAGFAAGFLVCCAASGVARIAHTTSAAGCQRKGGLDCGAPNTMAHLRRRGEACQTLPGMADQSCSWCSTAGATGPSARATPSRWRTRPPGHRLWNGYPRTLLDASGLAVGLPVGPDGQQRSRATSTSAPAGWCRRTSCASRRASSGASSTSCPCCRSSARWLRQTGGTLHLVGLLGPGGVHALDRHLLACVELGVRLKVPHIAIHGFLDGRDSRARRSAPRSCARCCSTCAASRAAASTSPRSPGATSAWTATSAGIAPARRTTRWSTASASPPSTRCSAVQAAYQRGETDEFVQPLVHHRDGLPVAHGQGRRRDLLLQLPQRPDAPDRARRSASRDSTGSTPAAGPRCAAPR